MRGPRQGDRWARPYFPVARAVAAALGRRDVTDNVRLLAVVAVVMDDTLIAVFDAKTQYRSSIEPDPYV